MGVVYQGLQDRLMLIAKVDYFVSMWPCLNLVQKSVDGGHFKLTAHGHPTLAIDVCDPAQWKKPSFKVRLRNPTTTLLRCPKGCCGGSGATSRGTAHASRRHSSRAGCPESGEQLLNPGFYAEQPVSHGLCDTS
ncbi:uncharacterized protein LOC144139843 isoform X3 [Haemaphysalis longicornis]